MQVDSDIARNQIFDGLFQEIALRAVNRIVYDHVNPAEFLVRLSDEAFDRDEITHIDLPGDHLAARLFHFARRFVSPSMFRLVQMARFVPSSANSTDMRQQYFARRRLLTRRAPQDPSSRPNLLERLIQQFPPDKTGPRRQPSGWLGLLRGICLRHRNFKELNCCHACPVFDSRHYVITN